MEKEYLYQAKIIDEKTDEILIKISSFSQVGLEEEMGKSKWTEAVKRHEEKLEKERLQDAEDAMDEELEWSHNNEMKREEMYD